MDTRPFFLSRADDPRVEGPGYEASVRVAVALGKYRYLYEYEYNRQMTKNEVHSETNSIIILHNNNPTLAQ